MKRLSGGPGPSREPGQVIAVPERRFKELA